ncbi:MULTISPECIES: hypothetical protein [Flectobacillus]|uniref:Uncharacterized protein n=1 Tax=Flectobacillus roseus TaxID=502259 RepID=A0ABT6YCF3_9BACT|nr:MULTISPECIES: hypothetical protein [Flectobacillus]MDI9861274.1 hypothetical protein [Flectobacillus roseus]MDI9871441.1 hypothetical protein [Flectobacillus roseus]PAC32888.1 hypothetical protein BWI92_03385 [Flectobacillus sp. BAB-3569]
MLLQINVTELGSFLKYGVTGLSAIAFILSYFLLFRESSRPKPRPEIIKTIRLFMWVTVILGVVSGVSSILKPNTSEDTIVVSKPKKTSPKKAVAHNSLTSSSDEYTIEIFYENPKKALAEDLADVLKDKTSYDVKVSALSSTKKSSLKITSCQIRHELQESKIAGKLKSIAENVLQDDGVEFKLKQITSSSPNYVSMFVCK